MQQTKPITLITEIFLNVNQATFRFFGGNCIASGSFVSRRVFFVIEYAMLATELWSVKLRRVTLKTIDVSHHRRKLH